MKGMKAKAQPGYSQMKYLLNEGIKLNDLVCNLYFEHSARSNIENLVI